LTELATIYLATTPWELAHARRANRANAAAALESAAREPGHRLEHYWESGAMSNAALVLPDPLDRLSRPIQAYLAADEENEIPRRALVQIIAIRAWQLKHAGRFPDRLEMLVPEELKSLPIDPYSDRQFGFVAYTGGVILPLRAAISAAYNPSEPAAYKPIESERIFSPKEGSWLLYSVGPDREDNGGVAITSSANYRIVKGYDIVFAIPPVGNDAGKAEGEGNPKPAVSQPPAAE
jgi:hypothetical protein